jgi:hypothetical protein
MQEQELTLAKIVHVELPAARPFQPYGCDDGEYLAAPLF